MQEATKKAGLELVQLVTPTTPQSRMKRIAEISQGFVYLVSVTGKPTRRSFKLNGMQLPYSFCVYKILLLVAKVLIEAIVTSESGRPHFAQNIGRCCSYVLDIFYCPFHLPVNDPRTDSPPHALSS